MLRRSLYTKIFFFFVISLVMVVVPSPKIVINLPGTYVKLPCHGEPDWFSSSRDPSVQTDKQTDTHPVTLL